MICSSKSIAQVTLPHLESINYATGGSGLQAQTGWTVLNTGDDLLISAGNLSYSGMPASIGNKVTFDGAGIDGAKLFTQQTSGTVYYSFLLNVTALGTLNTTGGYFSGFSEGTTTTFGATIWTRRDVNTTGYNIGINPRTTTGLASWSPALTVNTTYLIVVSYQMVAGTINDIVKIWVNPAIGGSEPAATATATNSGITADLVNLNRIILRQDANSATPSIQMDELRIGTNWPSVTPSTSTPVVTAASLNGTVGSVFSYNILATGSPTSYSISSGSLPTGLTLNTGPGLGAGTISGTPTVSGPFSADVTATNTNGTGPASTIGFTIALGNQTITGLPATDTRTYTAALQQYNLTATGGASGNTVSYSSDNSLVASIIGNQITINGAGTANITASQAGDANYNAATNVVQVLTVNKAIQVIGFGTPIDKNDVDPNFEILANGGGSGNPLTYTSSNTAVAEIVDINGNIDPNGSYVDIIGPGQTTITASQAGNNNYLAATPVQRVQHILNTALIPQVITFDPLPSKTYGDDPFLLTATGGGSNNPITYTSSDVAIAVITDENGNIDPNGSYLKILAPGTVVITANQAGDGGHNPASPVFQGQSINRKFLTISGATADNKPYDGTNAATISGGTLIGVLPGDVVNFSGAGTFAGTDAGTYPVTTALILGGADEAKYLLTQPTLSATITQLSQTIVFAALVAKTFGNADYTLSATGGASGQPITYTSSDPLVATITGNTVHIVGGGTTLITASQAGNINYSAAPDVSQSQLVNTAIQSITFATILNKTTADAPFTLAATASSGLTVSYSSSDPAVASVAGNTVTLHSVGITTITATQSGNSNYSATTSTRTFAVTSPLIAAWDFTGPGATATFAATVFSGSLTSSNLITRGSTATASAAANSFRTTGFKNEGISVSNTDYFQTTLSVGGTNQLSLSDIAGKYAGTTTFVASPGVTSQFAYSLNGSSFTLIGSPVTSTSLIITPIDLTGISALQNIPPNTTVTFRYYASGQTTTGGWGFTSNSVGDYGLTFGGTVTNVGCSGTPVSSNITSLDPAVCYGSSAIDLALSFSYADPGITYQWASSTVSGGPYTNLGTNNTQPTGPLTQAAYFICTVTCTNSGLSFTTEEKQILVNPLPSVSFSGLASTYCTTDAAVTLIGNPEGGLFTGPGIVGNQFDPSVAGTGGPYNITYQFTDAFGCSASSTQQVTVTVCPLFTTLNLTLFLQGFYREGSTMAANKFDLGLSSDDTEVDDITISLWSEASLSNEFPDYSVSAILHTNGTAMTALPAEVSGNSYYIAVKHRNSIETWSKLPVVFTTDTDYDFSSGPDQAFGDGVNDPTINVEGVYLLYGGDVNQDGGIDATDLGTTFNDANTFEFGYIATDVTGDGGPDASDLALIYNNSQLFLFYARPY